MLLRSLFLFTVLALSVSPGYAQIAGEGGLKAEITGVAIPGDRRPVVTFKIADAKGWLEVDWGGAGRTWA